MKTEKEWLDKLHTAHDHSTPECCCERCKNGLESFLIPSDIKAIQLDAYEKGIRDAAEIARKTYAGWEWNFMYQDASQTIGNEIESLLPKPKDKE